MSLTPIGRDVLTDADSFSCPLEHNILLRTMLSSWEEKDQTAHVKDTTYCWSNLIDCTQFSPKHNKIYVKHRAVLAYNLLFAETSLCDGAYQVLLKLASSFWANPPFFARIINCLHYRRAERPAEAGSHCAKPCTAHRRAGPFATCRHR